MDVTHIPCGQDGWAHLAAVNYGGILGLEEGRSSDRWVDFNFFGHQLVIHEHPKTTSQEKAHTNPVDGHDVPVPHFGVVLPWDQWETLNQ